MYIHNMFVCTYIHVEHSLANVNSLICSFGTSLSILFHRYTLGLSAIVDYADIRIYNTIFLAFGNSIKIENIFKTVNFLFPFN